MAWGVSQGIGDIVERIERNDDSLQSLYLMRHRRFNEDDARLLSNALSRNSTLVELNLSSHNIGTSVAKIIAEGLQRNSSIKYISIGNSQFGDDAMIELCACLGENCTIQTLDIERKGITGRSASSLCAAIRESISVKSLIVSNNELKEGLIDLLPCLEGLVNLEMHNCGMHHQNAPDAMAEALMLATSLTSLELDRNDLDDIDAKVISRGLKGCRALESLSLNGNPLGPSGIRHIAHALPESLKRLDLGSTAASGDGISSIMEVVSQRRVPNLTYLNICGCGADNIAVAGILDAVSQVGLTLSLDAGGNNLGSEGIEYLAKSLVGCTTLQSIRLHGCGIGGDGVCTLVQSVKDKGVSGKPEHALEDLDISGNMIDEASMIKVLQELPEIVSTIFANLSSLIIAANPNVEGQEISKIVESLASHETTNNVVIMRAASDSSQQQG